MMHYPAVLGAVTFIPFWFLMSAWAQMVET